jgi:hypothetical protein
MALGYGDATRFLNPPFVRPAADVIGLNDFQDIDVGGFDLDGFIEQRAAGRD